jgi:hypothetical protein
VSLLLPAIMAMSIPCSTAAIGPSLAINPTEIELAIIACTAGAVPRISTTSKSSPSRSK